MGPTPLPGEPTSPDDPAAVETRGSRSILLWVLLGAGVLALVGLGFVLLMSEDDDPTEVGESTPSSAPSSTASSTSLPVTTLPNLQPALCDDVLALIGHMGAEDRDYLVQMGIINVGPLLPEGIRVYGVTTEVPPDPTEFTWLPTEGLARVGGYYAPVDPLTFPWFLEVDASTGEFTCSLTPAPEPTAPDELGVSSEWGMEYPSPPTCEETETFFAMLQDTNNRYEPPITLLEGDSIWLAIDPTTDSADVWIPSNRSIVKLRNADVMCAGAPASHQFPALSGEVECAFADMTYAVSAGTWLFNDCFMSLAVG